MLTPKDSILYEPICKHFQKDKAIVTDKLLVARDYWKGERMVLRNNFRMVKLFCILTGVVVTGSYSCAKIHRTVDPYTRSFCCVTMKMYHLAVSTLHLLVLANSS